MDDEDDFEEDDLDHDVPGSRKDRPVPEATAPVFTTPSPNSSIELYAGNVSTTTLGGSFSGPGRVWLQWLPTPVIRFELQAEHSPFSGPCHMNIDGSAPTEAVMLSSPSPHNPRWEGVVNGPIETGTAEFAQRVVFHQVNLFSQHYGRVVRNAESTANWAGRISTAGRGMRVHVDRLEGLGGLLEMVKEQGGYVITHAGVIEAAPSMKIGRAEYLAQLERLFFALSMIRGGWSAPILLVGFDSAGQRCWDYWQLRRVRAWSSGVHSWSRDLGSLNRALTQLDWKLGKDDGGTTSRAISWYLDANHDPLAESSLIRAQVALEVLCWAVTAGALSEDGHKKLQVADRLRVSLALRSVPTTIPDSLKALRKFAAAEAQQEGPDVLANLRNCIVHSGKKERERLARASDLCLIEARELAIWYVELLLLSQAKYSGDYASRVEQWKIDPVPWSMHGE